MSALPILPQHIINIIYQFNTNHRILFESSLYEIYDKSICKTCNQKCELDFCLKPNSHIFCNQQCMSFWNAMQYNEEQWNDENADEDFINLQDQDQDSGQDHDDLIYDYLV